MRCAKSVRLRGGFTAEVRRARKPYTCFYCRKPISPGEHYAVVEGVKSSLVERYHLQCFNHVMPHRLIVARTSEDPLLCHVLEDESVL